MSHGIGRRQQPTQRMASTAQHSQTRPMPTTTPAPRRTRRTHLYYHAKLCAGSGSHAGGGLQDLTVVDAHRHARPRSRQIDLWVHHHASHIVAVSARVKRTHTRRWILRGATTSLLTRRSAMPAPCHIASASHTWLKKGLVATDRHWCYLPWHLLTAHAMGNRPQQVQLQRGNGRRLVRLGVGAHAHAWVVLRHDVGKVPAVGLKRWQVDDEGWGVDGCQGVADLGWCPRGAQARDHLVGGCVPAMRYGCLR